MRPPLRYAVGLALALAAAFALVVGGAAPPASAHAYLSSSTPSDGSSLGQAPRSVELHFTEHVVLESTEVVVTDTQGRRLQATTLTLVGEDEDRESPSTVVAALPPLGIGAYHVTWRTLSADDLHESGGVLAFGVQSAVRAAGPSEASPDLLELAGRWAVLAALAAGLGAVVVGRLLLRGGQPGAPAPGLPAVLRLRRLARRALWVGAAAALLLLVADVVRFGGQAVTSTYAVRWGARELALVVAALALVPSRSSARPASGRRDAAAVSALAAAGLATVLVGHTGLRGGTTWVLASTAHLLASLAWLGAVGALTLVAVRARGLGLSRGEVASLLRRFAVPATSAVVVVVVSGVYLASDVIVSVDAGLVTTYGRIFVAKLVAAAVVGLIALGTARAVRAGSAARVPRLRREAVGLTVVVALGGLLATGQPATAPQLVTRDEPSVVDSRAVADLQQTVALRPNRPGASVAMVDVFDTRRPSPGPVTGVTVSLRYAAAADTDAEVARPASDPVAAQQVTGSRWAAGIELPADGAVDLDVAVHRRGLDDVRSTIRWVVAPSTPVETVVSRAPIAGPLAWTALVLAVLAVLGGLAAAALLRSRLSSRRARAAGGVVAAAADKSDTQAPERLSRST
ncbi:hypothetical protein GCM10027039_40750 [Terrabacter koreensis]